MIFRRYHSKSKHPLVRACYFISESAEESYKLPALLASDGRIRVVPITNQDRHPKENAQNHLRVMVYRKPINFELNGLNYDPQEKFWYLTPDQMMQLRNALMRPREKEVYDEYSNLPTQR